MPSKILRSKQDAKTKPKAHGIQNKSLGAAEVKSIEETYIILEKKTGYSYNKEE